MMRATVGLLVLLLSGGLALQADEPSQADLDWQAWMKARSAPMPEPSHKLTMRERLIFSEQRSREAQEAAVRFLDRHPDDPRRWEMISWLSPNNPRFVLRWGDNDARGRPIALEVDHKAAAAWRERVSKLKEEMMAAEDVPEDLKKRLARQNLMRPFYDADPHYELEPVDLPALRRYLEAHIGTEPGSDMATNMLSSYMGLFAARHDEERTTEEWKSFIDSPHEGVRRMAQGKVSFAELSKHPIDIRFTAVDGREVDLRELRGQVVLLHFWATWCGSCIAEMPNVIEAWQKFHDRGFTIVGISSDRDKQKLLDYVREHRMPWPQYFPEEGRNRYSAQFGITGIPTKFLLDRDGRIVNTATRGPELLTSIEQLLEQKSAAQ